MIDGTYTIDIDSPLGRKPGTVTLRSEGARAIGEIDAPVIGKQHAEGQLEDEDSFTAQGTFKLLFVGKVEYSLRGHVDGDSLHIAIDSNKGSFTIEGKRTR